jgi:hypothetical protein
MVVPNMMSKERAIYSSANNDRWILRREAACSTIERSFACYWDGDGPMDQNEDPDKLERQIERARRLASHTTDKTTFQRLWVLKN